MTAVCRRALCTLMEVAGLIGGPGMVEPWATFQVDFGSSYAFGPLLPLRAGGSYDKAGLAAHSAPAEFRATRH